MTKLNCKPEPVPGRINFMSMYNDITWRDKENERTCFANSATVLRYEVRFGTLVILGPGSETKWNATDTCKPGHQLSIYGTVADLCEEFGTALMDFVKTYMVMGPPESMAEPTDLFDNQRFPTNKQERSDLSIDHRERVQNLSDEEQLIKSSTDEGFCQNSCSWTILYDEGS